MKLIDKEEELKNILKEFGFEYGIGATTNRFLVQYLDNKSGVTLRNATYYNSPIEPIRSLQDFCNQMKFPANDVCINLFGVCSQDNLTKITPLDLELSPYLYYSKPEDSQSSSK